MDPWTARHGFGSDDHHGQQELGTACPCESSRHNGGDRPCVDATALHKSCARPSRAGTAASRETPWTLGGGHRRSRVEACPHPTTRARKRQSLSFWLRQRRCAGNLRASQGIAFRLRRWLRNFLTSHLARLPNGTARGIGGRLPSDAAETVVAGILAGSGGTSAYREGGVKWVSGDWRHA